MKRFRMSEIRETKGVHFLADSTTRKRISKGGLHLWSLSFCTVVGEAARRSFHSLRAFSGCSRTSATESIRV